MDLLLWRHAEASDGFPDLQRALSARGEKQARQMVKWINKNAPKKLRVIASPAVRTQQTAAALGRPFATDSRLSPDADVADLLAAVGWPDGDDEAADGECTVLVVGHQPTLGRVAALLLSGQEADWAIKKGAVWWFSGRVREGETQTVLRAVIPPDSGC
jgi:phosphohistidine phosphatase